MSRLEIRTSTILDENAGLGLARLGSLGLDSLDNIHAINNLSEDDVLAIQPGGGNGGNEELGSIGARTSVGHRKETRDGVLDGEVLIGKTFSIDGFASHSVTLGDISSLEHELRNDLRKVQSKNETKDKI
jgi:hypothetical protein